MSFEFSESCYDYKIPKDLPIIARSSIRNFERLTKKLKKPYSKELYDLIQKAMLLTSMEIEGCVFSYHFHDQVLFVLKNKNSAAYNNKIQEISSIISSIITSSFLKHFIADDIQPDIVGDVVFKTNAFSLTDTNDATNFILNLQKENYIKSLYLILEDELLKTNSSKITFNILKNTSLENKLEMLSNMNINTKLFDKFFLYGSACYKQPKLFEINNKSQIKKKWLLNKDLKDIDFSLIYNIINSGSDIYR